MKIGFDIDGCINNFSEDLIELLKNEYNIENISDSTYNMLESLNIITIEEHRAFYKKHQQYFESRLPKENAQKVINLLGYNNDVFIITARNYDEAIWTERWLNKCGIKYNELIFNAENKVGACKWKKIDIMVEDNPINALALAKEGIKVLLFDCNYNKDVEHENIIRCYNWNEIFKYIKGMK